MNLRRDGKKRQRKNSWNKYKYKETTIAQTTLKDTYRIVHRRIVYIEIFLIKKKRQMQII